MERLAQGWISANCSEFIGKDEWPPVDVLAWSSSDTSLKINVLVADDAQRAVAYCACKIITMLSREVLVT